MQILLNKSILSTKLFYPYIEDLQLLPKDILDKVLEDKDFFNKIYQSKRYFLNQNEVVVIHLGKKEGLSLETLRRFGSIIVNTAKKNYDTNFDICFDIKKVSEFKNDMSEESIFYSLMEGIFLTDYEYDKFKTKKDKKFEIKKINIISDTQVNFEKLKEKLDIIKNAIFLTRDLVNAPANVVNINYIEDEARRVAKDNNLKITVINKEQLVKDGFNLLYSVGKAGSEPPRLIELGYSCGKNVPNICLIGKGIVFDTGGLNLKPENFMSDMKSDMAGAGSVLSLIECISKLKLDVNVTALLPLAENAIDSNSYRPGDVIFGYNKKSVEILNTDAEGRLILADALSYADTKNFDLIIDFATLTGAAVIALGTKIAVSYFKSDKYKDMIFKSSKKMGEPI
ncbi:MAG TPA: leucyl aminopeptidase family protein, partial [Spirochaetota bacterium]|nr:leucyl aminopeptidase family protein [Spirochaetota bacterium]